MHLLARGLRSHIVAVGASLALAVAADGADALRLDRIYDFGRYEQGGGLVQGPQGEFYVGFFSLRTNAWIVASPPGDGSLQYLFTLPYDNGRPPGYPLIRARDGYFYGTTEFTGRYGRGSIFRASVDGSVTTIHDFDTVHGASPRAGLVEGPDGRLYGVADGGPISQGFYGHGIVFGVEGGGTFADLYDFPVSGKDGFSPEQRLVVGEHGWLFGVTYVGGQNGYGTIFRMKPGGPLHTIYDFSEADGWPVNSLTAGADGHLYGTALSGGPSGYGTVFRVTPQGKFGILASFDGKNGGFPSSLVQGPDGLFYGTAWQLGHGIVFSVGSDSPLQTRYTFTADEGTPEGPVFIGADGALYGSTGDGGQYGRGIIFRLSAEAGGRVD